MKTKNIANKYLDSKIHKIAYFCETFLHFKQVSGECSKVVLQLIINEYNVQLSV